MSNDYRKNIEVIILIAGVNRYNLRGDVKYKGEN